MQKHDVEVNLLCVVNRAVARSPQKVYASLKKLGVRHLQFIACLDPIEGERGAQPWALTPEAYGKFLCGLFDVYYRDWVNGDYTSVRLFDDYIHMAMGMPAGTCATSGSCGAYFVVEGDGTVYPCDFYCLDEWEMLEQRYANENAIWDAAACGNTEAALKACQQMARFTYGGRFFGSLYQTKIMLTVMNTLLRKAIERSNIHPYYIDEISSRYALMIENMVDEESWPLVQTMVKEYCAYVRRYSLQQYSPLVQKVINTINLNLSDQLSPKSLAAMYYISPSYLSSLFKQDTGTTLTDFINTQRIQRAANLLSTTEQNISVVAEQVGILDVNYFTKMFKKSMGSTPTQYRRQSRAR